MASQASAPDADAGSAAEGAPQINFTVKTSKDQKYQVTLSPTSLISELKSKLLELSEIPTEQQRLIYSGRVMKDEETLAFYKVQSGHTIHLVKGAASNQRAAVGGNPPSSSSTTAATPSIPRNIAAGAGNNPLAGLTGARYAGLAPLPSADIFGPDGGMGPPPDPEQMHAMLSTPGFQATMNEMLQNPQMLEYIIESNPTLRSIPGAREMMRSQEFRNMMTNPDLIRQAGVMQRALGGRGGAAPSFPAPGVTDTTPVQPGQGDASQQQPQHPQPPLNLFGAGAGGNPFAALFGAPPPGAQPTGTAQSPQAPFPGLPGNPYASLANIFGGPPGAGAAGASPPAGPGAGGPPVDWNAMSEMLRHAYGGAGGPGGAGDQNTPGANAQPQIPPYLLNLLGSQGAGSLGGFGSPPPPVDNRPPEERYAEQLRQLNDMGFYDFDRNIEALRRTGGSVQGAIQHLLGD
ncbi:putative ubiquitin-like protein DskB [Peziza echinospora]|nr:putative ubiquitin-like protein DskB [Peziza echinospora]